MTRFLAFCGDPCRGRARPSGAVVYSARRGQRCGLEASPSPFHEVIRTRPTGGSRHVCARPARDSSGTPSATSSGARRPTSSSTSGSSRSSWPRSTGKTLYVRAPEHIRTWVAERYLPLLRRAAAQSLRPPCGGRGRRRRLVGADASATRRAPMRRRDARERPEPQVHLRAVRDRRGQPLRPRRRAGGRRAARPGLQPALPPRPARARQDPPAPRDRQLRPALRLAGCASATRRSRSSRPSSSTPSARRRTGDFKDDFRSADVVLIDDVQFLAGRTKTREEFFHTFNALLDSGRQLVLTSDRTPEDLPDLEDRLVGALPRRAGRRARAAAGRVCAGPSSPSAPASTASRCRPTCWPRSPLAVDSSVRALEGALIRVVAYASLKGEQPTPGAGAPRPAPPRRGHRAGRRCGISRDHRRGGRRSSASSATRCSPATAARRRHGPPGRDVPGARAHRAQPSRDRPRRSAAATTPPSCTRSTAISAALRHRSGCAHRGRQPPPAPRPPRLTADVTDTIHSCDFPSIPSRKSAALSTYQQPLQLQGQVAELEAHRFP